MTRNTLEATETKIDLKSERLIEEATAYKNSISNSGNAQEIRQQVGEKLIEFCRAYVRIGNQLFENDVDISGVSLSEKYLIFFSTPESFKDLAFLSKDVLLQLNLANIRFLEGLVSEDEIENHSQKCRTALVSASEKFRQRLMSEKERIQQSDREQKKIARVIRHQSNPWPIYAGQFDIIIEQIDDISSAQEALVNTIDNFISIKKIIQEVADNNNAFNQVLCGRVSEILKSLKEGNDEDALISKIDDALHEHSKYGNKHDNFTLELGRVINLLDNLKLPIRSDEGFLKNHHVQLNKVVQKWFDYEVLPLFMDLMAQEGTARAKFQSSLLNVQNTLRHSKSQEPNSGINPSIRTLELLWDGLNGHQKAGTEISQKINSSIKSQLLVSNLYSGKPFLEVSINAAISSTLDIGKNKIVRKFKNSYRRVFQYFNSKYRDSEFHESFSAIEITTKCIAHRMYKEENEHYDTLFLSKNFIGDLFLVNRKRQDKKLAEAIEQWNNGFPKAALVFGDRLSGRTTFINATAKKHFGPDVVTLQPKSTSIIDGRKFSTTCNLGEALDYIKKYNSKSTRPAIVIDDLEFWHDDSVSLLDNIRSLTDFIENESDNAFVVAVCTDSMRHQLDSRLHLSDIFSTHIDISKADKDEILEAILLRHGAGHRTLVSENGEAISNNKIRSIAMKMAKNYGNNIGEVLQAWTFNTFVKDEQKVLFSKKEFEFLDYFSSDELIILKQASLFRKINEHGLRKVCPKGYESHLKSAVKRLINTKVMLRDSNGNLYINPVTLYDIRKILRRKRYLIK